MKKMTKKDAKEIIELKKSDTAFFGENNIDIFGEPINTRRKLYEMFRYRFKMGEAETECIIASLVLAGATIIE